MKFQIKWSTGETETTEAASAEALAARMAAEGYDATAEVSGRVAVIVPGCVPSFAVPLCPVCGQPAGKIISAPRGWGENGPATGVECTRCAAQDGWPWTTDEVVQAPGCEPVAYCYWIPDDTEVERLAATL